MVDMQLLPVVEFGNKLRSLRESHGWSVRELAKAAEVSSSLISALENARRSAGLVTGEKLAVALNLSEAEKTEFLSLSSGTRGAKRLLPGTRRKGLQALEKFLAAVIGVEQDEVREIFLETELIGNHGYDIVVQLRSKQVYGVEITDRIEQHRIFVVPGNVHGELPDANQARTLPGTKILYFVELAGGSSNSAVPYTRGVNSFDELEAMRTSGTNKPAKPLAHHTISSFDQLEKKSRKTDLPTSAGT